MNTRRSSSDAGAANTTLSPSFKSMMPQESIVVGDSRFQRLTTPLSVPMASGGWPSDIDTAVTTRSPMTGSVLSVERSSSSACTPPATDSVS